MHAVDGLAKWTCSLGLLVVYFREQLVKYPSTVQVTCGKCQCTSRGTDVESGVQVYITSFGMRAQSMDAGGTPPITSWELDKGTL